MNTNCQHIPNRNPIGRQGRLGRLGGQTQTDLQQKISSTVWMVCKQIAHKCATEDLLNNLEGLDGLDGLAGACVIKIAIEIPLHGLDGLDGFDANFKQFHNGKSIARLRRPGQFGDQWRAHLQ